MQEEQNASFQDRVDRITARAQEAKKGVPRKKAYSIWSRLGYPAAFIGAFFLGVGAVFLSRYIQYNLVGLPGEAEGSSADIIGFIIAGGAVFLISFLLKGNQKEFASVSAFAMLMTTFTFHNAVWAYPELFERVYGEDWVEFMQDITKPSSLQLFTLSVEFG